MNTHEAMALLRGFEAASREYTAFPTVDLVADRYIEERRKLLEALVERGVKTDDLTRACSCPMCGGFIK